jgi:adenylate cyclase
MTDTAHARRNAERLAGLTEPYLTLDQAATRAGLEPAQIAAIWTATGLPTPDPDDPCLGDGDVEILRAIADLQACGLTDPDFVMQLARVCGRHLRRIADAQISAARQQARNGDLTDHARHTVPILERALTHLWRRHLADAATRALLDADDSGDACAIGFVDLVGFTARSQQLDDHQLAELVTAFEQLATTTAGRHGGTVVKTMGDEVLFVHDEPEAAARIALELIERCDDDPVLPVARGGLAWGYPLAIGGDYFGPPVNLASRIVKLALPGTILADPALAEQLHDVADLTTKQIRSQPVRDVGDIALHVLRRAPARTRATV